MKRKRAVGSRRRVEAWAVVDEHPELRARELRFATQDEASGEEPLRDEYERLIHLVEADPLREAVVRAAVRAVETPSGRYEDDLTRAVERLRAGSKGKR